MHVVEFLFVVRRIFYDLISFLFPKKKRLRRTLNTKTYHLVQLLLEDVAYKYAKTKSDEYAVEE